MAHRSQGVPIHRLALKPPKRSLPINRLKHHPRLGNVLDLDGQLVYREKPYHPLRRNPVLFNVAIVHLVLFVAMLGEFAFDACMVLGINPWIQPMKFALSMAVYGD